MLISSKFVARLGRAALFHSQPAPAAITEASKDANYAVLPKKVSEFIEEAVRVCAPSAIHVCDGSASENENFVNLMVQKGTIQSLPKYDNCWLARTDPKDVARVESRTVISTERREQVIPNGKNPSPGALPNWMSPQQLNTEVMKRFPNSMKGRTMYVIPFSMGPVGSGLSKIGIQLTDSPYVASSMRIMTRMGSDVLQLLTENHDMDFVKCLHSVGRPLEAGTSDVPWPCNPQETMISHKPETNEIISYGSGYGGNSLLGKKCLALRLGSYLAKKEGWLAEHMLILGITNPEGVKKYIAAAFPSACGKTNLAMMTPKLPGWKVECVGDDIAWMRFNKKTGMLHAINPENGFFGVAPGTSDQTNPVAMATIFKDTVFTNVASTSDGGVWWEGLPLPQSSTSITSWTGESNWHPSTHKTPAAHPNSRFCSPAKQCPILDASWENPEGVPISAILFGGRRPEGVPLVYESYDWDHGVYIGASMRSEATAAAEFQGKAVMHDPFAMRPFVGYNMGEYFNHWLSFKGKHHRLPKIFHVNWFRKDAQGKFMWPGFGDNVRVLDWILRRVDGEANSAEETPIGYIPRESSFDVKGLDKIKWNELFSLPKDFWLNELSAIEKYFSDNIGSDLPPNLTAQLEQIRRRFNKN